MTSIAIARDGRRAARSGTMLDMIRTVFAAISERRRKRADVALLMHADERLLADIGIARSDVERVVYRGR